MKEDWSIFNVSAAQFLVTYYPIVIQISLKFFLFYLLDMPFLSYCSAWRLLDIRTKSSMYILIIKISTFLLAIRMLGLAFSRLNLGVLKNSITF